MTVFLITYFGCGLFVFSFFIDFIYYFRGVEIYGLIKGIIERRVRDRKVYTPLVEVLDGERDIYIMLSERNSSLAHYKIGDSLKLLRLKRGTRFYRLKRNFKKWLIGKLIEFLGFFLMLFASLHKIVHIEKILAFLLSLVLFSALYILMHLIFVFYKPSLGSSKLIPSESLPMYKIFWSQEEVDETYFKGGYYYDRMINVIVIGAIILQLWIIYKRLF